MQSERAVKWEPVPNIDYPCAALQFSYSPPDQIDVIMRFSDVANQPPRDLRLKFTGAVSARWSAEYCDYNQPSYDSPMCAAPQWKRWVHPMLRIENSLWLAELAANQPLGAEGRVHFVLVTMNDILELLALPEVACEWIDAED